MAQELNLRKFLAVLSLLTILQKWLTTVVNNCPSVYHWFLAAYKFLERVSDV